jgi:hypothetical protein
MSSINDFLTNNNFQLICEVVKEYELVSNNQRIMEQLNLFIQQKMPEFYEVEKKNLHSLKEMNKKFIIYTINYINNYFSSQEYEDPKSNVNVKSQHQSQVKAQLITFEEIQKERQSNFEKQLLEKQKDFSESIKINIPPTPNFSDNLDQPLSETEKLVEKMKQQRFLEEETFKNTTLNMNSSENSNEKKNWLKSQETSIKKEKNVNNTNTNNNANNYTNNSNVQLNPPIKYIKIENDILSYGIEKKDIINLDSNNEFYNGEKKHITWKDDNITININEENNIFSKLKKVNSTPIKKVSEILENNESSNLIDEEVKILKDEMKTIHTKINELDQTMNNVLTYLKSKNISLN